MMEFVAGIMMLIGGSFSLIAGIGMVRLPDVYVRMHAATKAGTLGAGLILVALAFEAQQLEVVARALAGVIFLFFTAPIAAHLLGRAAYLAGVPLWSQSCRDDLEGKYAEGAESLSGTDVSKVDQ